MSSYGEVRYRYYSGRKEEVIEALRRVLCGRRDVKLAIVFGSFVELDAYRDVDIAVYMPGWNIKRLALLADMLEREAGVPVDVVPLDELPPKFRYYVLIHGMVLVENEAGVYEALLSQTLDELMDIELAERF